MKDVFPTFDEIEYQPLRTWNRCVFFFNLREDSGPEMAKKYLMEFQKEDLREMYKMYYQVLKQGREAIYKQVTSGMPLQLEDEEIVYH